MLSVPPAPPALPAQDSLAVDRLVAIGKLWSTARFFHPYLAYRDIDWDSAFAAAASTVSAARSTAEYAATVHGMLDALGDGATRVVREEASGAPSVGERHPLSRWVADSVLLITATNYADLDDFPGAIAKFRAIGELAARARGVVLDLRRMVPSADASPTYALLQSRLLNRLVAETLAAPGHRSRMHSGYRPDAVGGGFYYSAWQTRDGQVLVPTRGAIRKPVVLVVNEYSDMPEAALALVAARRAALVVVGTETDAPLAQAVRLPLGETLEASLRLSELVFPDGSGGVRADSVLPTDANDSAVVRVAVALLSRIPLAARARPALPARAAPPPTRAYPEMTYPSLGYRLVAAFRIWSTMEYFHAYRSLYDEDWDATLRRLLPKFVAARDSLEYALAVAEFVSHIADTHGFVRSRVLEAYVGVWAPPIVVRMIQGVPIVTYVTNDSIARVAGIAVGDVILRVDGEAAAARLARYARLRATSTPQSRDLVAASTFLQGPEGSVATLAVRDRANRVREVRLPRRRADAPSCGGCRTGEMLKWLPDSIGYADLDRLPVTMVDSMFELFRRARGIIFDMRGYPLGTAWSIAPRLTDRESVVAARFRRPLALAPRGGTGDEATEIATLEFEQLLPRTAKWRYRGPTVMLIDERTISQAEHTGLFFEAANGTTFIGSPTTGSNGDVTTLVVPGGIVIGFTGHDVRHANGRQLQRVGLIPEIRVDPTIAGIRAGRDEVLGRAVAYLRERRSRRTPGNGR
jgi:C-terminal processing protease CtpA/Prc